MSYAEARGPVTFPDHAGERVYMREFRRADGLPAELSRWQQTVDQMLVGVDIDGPLYLMIDQAEVSAGVPHRRPGAHIDGYWHPATNSHDTHRPFASPAAAGAHGPRHEALSTHRPYPGRHRPSGQARFGWRNAHLQEEWAPEAVLLASDVAACRALVGRWDGPVGEGGDCSSADLSHLRELPMEAGRVYAGNVTMVHESLPVEADCRRTLVRINVPGWTPEAAAA